MSENIFKHLFNNIPEGVMKYYSRLPFSLRAGRSYRNTVILVNRSQWYSISKLNRHQFGRLRNLLVYSNKKVPFYRSLFKQISFDPLTFNDLSEFESIPLLHKKDVYDHYEALKSSDFNSLNSYTGYTGGTTGHPLRILRSIDSHFIEWAFIHTLWQRVGFTPKSKRIAFVGVPFRKDKITTWKYNHFHNELQLSPRHMNKHNLKDYVSLIKEFKPHYIYGLPSAITILARYLSEHELCLDGIRAVLCGSENINITQKSLISDAFNARLYSWYGQTEQVVLGGECEHSSDYHLFPEYGYTEIVDESGNTIKEAGKIGEIVGTGFSNMAMPFIRYRTGDFGEYATGSCACGRRYVRIRNIVGRRHNQYLVGNNGEHIVFSSIDTQKSAFENVYQWQFIQDRPGQVIVSIVANKNIIDDDITCIEKELNIQGDKNLHFSIVIVDDLIRTQTGKVKGLIQRIRD